jgi:hypothetical protein
MLCVLPGGLVDEAGTVHGEVELRALTGREEEILAAAGGAETASLVTAVLSRCVDRIGDVTEVDAGVVRRLLVADRQFILLRLREATFGDRVQGSVPCPWPDCGKRVIVSFSTRDVPVTASSDKGPLYTLVLSSEAMPEAEEPERTVEFRLPNGADQELVSPLLGDNEAAALSALLERCVLRLGTGTGAAEADALSPLARQEIERGMEEVAPSVDLTLDAECAECGREFSAPFDPHAFFFGELRVSSEVLYREVHQLAYHYHWSEREIMEMPRDQRSRYLAVLADEIERLNESA